MGSPLRLVIEADEDTADRAWAALVAEVYRIALPVRTEPLAIVSGEVEGRRGALVRVHDECLTSEVLGSLKCDCKLQLDHALDVEPELVDGREQRDVGVEDDRGRRHGEGRRADG